MFDIGLQEMVIIGVIALLVFGPSKLPELGRMVGRAMREIRRTSDEFRSTVETNLHMNDLDPVIAPPSAFATESAESATLESGDAAEVAVEPAPTAAPETGEPFLAQRGARLFHRRECAWVRRIPELDRVYLKQVVDARDQGLTECPVCEPKEA